MTKAIVQQSIFDGIRKLDNEGSEFWNARELMAVLGYKKWQVFCGVIENATENIESLSYNASEHFLRLDVKSKGRTGLDYKLSRLACYHIALACDSRGNDQVKLAKHYFVVKTREAETTIPVQSETLKLAELEITRIKAENEQLKMQIRLQELLLQNKQIDSSMLTMHGAQVVLALRGKSDQVVEIEKPTLEVIDEKTGVKFKGMSLNQFKDYANQKYGVRFKSGTEIGRFLESAGYGHLIAQTPRRILTDYIPDEFVDNAVKVLSTNHRQLLLGETDII